MCWCRGVSPRCFDVKIFQYCRSFLYLVTTGGRAGAGMLTVVSAGPGPCQVSSRAEASWAPWNHRHSHGYPQSLLGDAGGRPLIGRLVVTSELASGLRVSASPGLVLVSSYLLLLPADHKKARIAISFAQLKDGLSHPVTTLSTDWEWKIESQLLQSCTEHCIA